MHAGRLVRDVQQVEVVALPVKVVHSPLAGLEARLRPAKRLLETSTSSRLGTAASLEGELHSDASMQLKSGAHTMRLSYLQFIKASMLKQ